MVTFPPRDAAQTQSRATQRVLAVPWDRRIPKVRISTQQADALQVRSAYRTRKYPLVMPVNHGDKTFYSGLILVLIPDLNLGSVLDLLLFLLQCNKK